MFIYEIYDSITLKKITWSTDIGDNDIDKSAHGDDFGSRVGDTSGKIFLEQLGHHHKVLTRAYLLIHYVFSFERCLQD